MRVAVVGDVRARGHRLPRARCTACDAAAPPRRPRRRPALVVEPLHRAAASRRSSALLLGGHRRRVEICGSVSSTTFRPCSPPNISLAHRLHHVLRSGCRAPSPARRCATGRSSIVERRLLAVAEERAARRRRRSPAGMTTATVIVAAPHARRAPRPRPASSTSRFLSACAPATIAFEIALPS